MKQRKPFTVTITRAMRWAVVAVALAVASVVIGRWADVAREPSEGEAVSCWHSAVAPSNESVTRW